MGQNIIDLGFDITKFSKEKQAIYDDLMAIYDLSKKVSETKISMGGNWADLKAQVEALKKQVSDLQEANLKYAQSQQAANIEATKAVATGIKLTEAKKQEGQETAKLTGVQEAYNAGQKKFQEMLANNQIQLNKLRVSKKELADMFRADLITEEEYIQLLAIVNEETLKYSESNKQLTLGLKNMEKISQETEGSLNQLRAQLNLMVYVQDKMSGSTEEDIALKAELGEEIKRLTKDISDQEQAQLKFSRNVGNYANSMADGFEKVRAEIARLKAEGQSLEDLRSTDPAGFSARGGDAEIQRTTAAISELEKVQKVALNTNSNLTTTVAKLGREYITMASNGNVSKEFLEQFEAELIKATKEANDLKEGMKAMASQTRGFDIMSSAVNTVASSFQLAAGAAAMFGVKEENVAKITMQMVAVQNVANGVRELAREFTNKASAAGMFYAFVQKQIAVATDASAAASKRWMASLRLFGIAGTVIGAIVFAYKLLSDQLSDVARKQKILTDINDKAAESIGSELAVLETFRRKLNDVTLSTDERVKVAKKYNETAEDANKIDLTMIDNLQTINDKLSDQNTLIIQRAVSLAATAELGKKAADYVRNQLDYEQIAEKTGLSPELLEKEINFYNNRALLKKADFKLTIAEREEKTKLQKQQETILGLSTKEIGQLQNLIEKRNKSKQELKETGDLLSKLIISNDPKKGKESDVSDVSKKINDLILKNEEEYRIAHQAIKEKNIQDDIDAASRLLENEELSFAERIAAERDFYNSSVELIVSQRDFQLSQMKLKNAEEVEEAEGNKQLLLEIEKAYKEQKELVIINADAKIQAANRKSEAFITEEMEKGEKERLALKLKYQLEAQAHFSSAEEIRRSDITLAGELEMFELEKRHKSGLISDKKYQEEKLRISTETQVKMLKAELEFTQEVSKLAYIRAQAIGDQESMDRLAASFQKIKEISQKVNIAMQGLADISNKKSFSEEFKEWASDFANIAAAAGQTISFIGGLVDAANIRQKNAIQELINENNKYGEAELERITNSTLSEQDKAARVIQLKAEVDAKNQQYARRQKELDIQKAKFDKAAAISAIILNTAVSISKVLGNPFMVALVAALGAVQLAVAVATPIPTYAEGTDDHPGGLARYGEAGKEKVILPDGRSFIAEKDTTSYLPKGTKVIPLTSDSINNSMYGSMIQNTADRLALVEAIEKKGSNDAWKIAKWQAEQTRAALEANNKKQPINITNKISFDWISYVNKNINGKA